MERLLKILILSSKELLASFSVLSILLFWFVWWRHGKRF